MVTQSQIQSTNPFSFLSSPNQTSYKERLLEIAELMANQLREFPRKPPKETIDNDNVTAVKKFLKITRDIQDPRIPRCKTELVAYILGISSEVLKDPKNEGFEAFASHPPLNRYLAAYGDTLKVSTTGEILLRKGKKYLPWSQLKQEVVIPERNPVTNQPWLYGPDGIQNKNMFEWTELTPYKREDSEKWGRKLLFVFCCCCTPDYPNFIGDHTWLEFWLPNGEIISVGLYRGYKHKPNQNAKDPLRVQKGYLMQPDVTRFWPDTTIHEIPFEITEEQFQDMKNQIKKDKKDHHLPFQLLAENCTEYALRIARIANIEIPVHRPIWTLLAKRCIPRPFFNWGQRVSTTLPESLKTVCSIIIAFFLSFPLVAYGATKVDPQVEGTPLYTCWTDLLNPKKLSIAHPHTLGNETRKFIEASRRLQTP